MFDISERAELLQSKLSVFMDSHVYPAEAVYDEQMGGAGDPHFHPPVLEDLKAEARKRGLWNLFYPSREREPALTNLEYAPLAEIMGRSHLASEACNCAAPDTGNIEVHALFGTDEHKERYLKPLLEGRIRSAFAMTEPAVASSDATNVEMAMVPEGNGYLLNGRKWFASNGMHPHCRVLIVMGKTDPSAAPHRQQSMMVVPLDAPGVTVTRNLRVFTTTIGKGTLRLISTMCGCQRKTCSRERVKVSRSARLGLDPAGSITACEPSVWQNVRWN
jgi:acyl-CoA dehydrogenase